MVLLVLCHPCGLEYYVFDFGSIIVRKCVHPVRLRLPPLNEGKLFRMVLLVLCHPVGIEYYVFVFGSMIVRKCVHPVRLRLPPLNEGKFFRMALLVLSHTVGIFSRQDGAKNGTFFDCGGIEGVQYRPSS